MFKGTPMNIYAKGFWIRQNKISTKILIIAVQRNPCGTSVCEENLGHQQGSLNYQFWAGSNKQQTYAKFWGISLPFRSAMKFGLMSYKWSPDQATATPRQTNMSPKKGHKRDYFNKKYIFQPSFFRGYVSFQEIMHLDTRKKPDSTFADHRIRGSWMTYVIGDSKVVADIDLLFKWSTRWASPKKNRLHPPQKLSWLPKIAIKTGVPSSKRTWQCKSRGPHLLLVPWSHRNFSLLLICFIPMLWGKIMSFVEWLGQMFWQMKTPPIASMYVTAIYI